MRSSTFEIVSNLGAHSPSNAIPGRRTRFRAPTSALLALRAGLLNVRIRADECARRLTKMRSSIFEIVSNLGAHSPNNAIPGRRVRFRAPTSALLALHNDLAGVTGQASCDVWREARTLKGFYFTSAGSAARSARHPGYEAFEIVSNLRVHSPNNAIPGGRTRFRAPTSALFAFHDVWAGVVGHVPRNVWREARTPTGLNDGAQG